MKDFFVRLCIGCFSVCSFNFMYGFLCGFLGIESNPYTMGFFGCLAWWIVYDGAKEIGWVK